MTKVKIILQTAYRTYFDVITSKGKKYEVIHYKKQPRDIWVCECEAAIYNAECYHVKAVKENLNLCLSLITEIKELCK